MVRAYRVIRHSLLCFTRGDNSTPPTPVHPGPSGFWTRNPSLPSWSPDTQSTNGTSARRTSTPRTADRSGATARWPPSHGPPKRPPGTGVNGLLVTSTSTAPNSSSPTFSSLSFSLSLGDYSEPPLTVEDPSRMELFVRDVRGL